MGQLTLTTYYCCVVVYRRFGTWSCHFRDWNNDVPELSNESETFFFFRNMGIRVLLHHKTVYNYDRLVTLSPQIVRLRPASHSRTPVTSYSLRIEPKDHFINWQQDPQGNFLARLVFPGQTRRLCLEVDLVAEMTVINPFDFFLVPYAEKVAFRYEPMDQRE